MTAIDPNERPSRRSRAGEVLHAVHAQPGITRAELAAGVGLSSGMASDVVAALVAARWLSEGEARPIGGRGRPTRSLWPHPAGPLVAVAAIAHEDWRVEAVALGGLVIERTEARHDRDASAVLGRVAAAFAHLATAYPDRVAGFGVSVPGTVAGTQLVQAANLGWRELELSDVRPPSAAERPFTAGNDATYSALGELARGAAAGTATSLHLLIDVGIGGAVIDGGRLTTGAHGMAGEFGHMPFGSRRALCRCGARGCWNTELEGAALARGLKRRLPEDEVTFTRGVITAARAGGGAERRVLGRAAASLGRGAAGLVNAVDPELVVLSGLAAAMLSTTPEPLYRAFHGGLMAMIADRPPRLVPGTLGARGPLVGAMEAAFEPVLAHPRI